MNGTKITVKITWFVCPICGFDRICKVSEEAKGGVFVKCRKCSNEVEVKHEKYSQKN